MTDCSTLLPITRRQTLAAGALIGASTLLPRPGDAAQTALSTGQLRLAAFRTAAADQDLGIDENLIVTAARFDERDGARCMAALLNSGVPFTAVLCANDRLALGAIEALRARGIDCPRQISVTGFNDMPMLDLMRPRLTTVRIEQYRAGQVAAQTLLRLLNADDPEDVPVETILPVELVIRDSTAAAAS